MSDIDNTDERRTPGIILNLKEFPIFMSEAADSRDTGSRLLRADTVAIAAIALVAWACLGGIEPAHPETARNPAADSIADQFARPELKSASNAAYEHTRSVDRLNFAPRYGLLRSTPPGDGATAGSEAAATGKAENAGVVAIRNLPPGSVLSAGTRVSPTSWVLSRSDLANLVVSLPRRPRQTLKAELEFYSPDGSPAGTAAVEIGNLPSSKKAPRRGVVRHREAALTAPAAKVEAKDVKPPAPVGPNANASQSATATIKLPFLPAPIVPATPETANSAGRETMINLGIMP